MSLAFTSTPLIAAQARAEAIGYLALATRASACLCRCATAPPATTSAPPTKTARCPESPSSTSARSTPPSTPWQQAAGSNASTPDFHSPGAIS